MKENMTAYINVEVRGQIFAKKVEVVGNEIVTLGWFIELPGNLYITCEDPQKAILDKQHELESSPNAQMFM